MLTVGNLLKKAREHSGKELKEIAQYLRIKPKYLKNIEQNEFNDFASSTYVKGFIRSYASYLGLDAENIVAIFRRQIGEEETPIVKKMEIKKGHGIVLSPATIMTSIVVTFFIGLFSFLVYQFYTLKKPPLLKVTSPSEEVITVAENSFEIIGITETSTIVSINNAQIKTDKNQSFKYTVELKEGLNTYKIEAWKKNLDGEHAEKLLQITYDPKSTKDQNKSKVKDANIDKSTQDKDTSQTIDATFTLSGESWIQIVADDIQKAVGIKKKGYKSTVTAENMYEVTTGKPNNSVITINGKIKPWRISKGIGYMTCSKETGHWVCE